MHAPPSVSYPVERSRLPVALAAVLWAGGAAGVAAWLVQVAAPAWQRGFAAALLLACGASAARALRHAARGTLSWDGSRWQWLPAGGTPQTGFVEPTLDLQSHLLVRWHPDTGRGHWFWLTQAHAPLHWSALRRAVHFRGAHPAIPRA